MPVKRGKSRKTVSGNIRREMHEYERTGKIGRSKPASKKKAQKQAVAIALNKARESGATEAEIRKGGSTGRKSGRKSARRGTTAKRASSRRTTKRATSRSTNSRKTGVRKTSAGRRKSAGRKSAGRKSAGRKSSRGRKRGA
jgi:hypothetical protein